MRLVLLMAMLACGPLAQAAGGIYKWVDEKGNVQYRDVPPPPGSGYQVIHKPPAPSQDPGVTMEKLRGQVKALDKEQEDVQRTKADLDLEAKRAESCKQAQRNVEVLQKSENPIRTEADGRQAILNAEQRQEEIEKNQKWVKEYCKP